MVIGILIWSAAWHNPVEQQQALLELGWVTVLVGQFLAIVFWMRLKAEALSAAFVATVGISLWDYYSAIFIFIFIYRNLLLNIFKKHIPIFILIILIK